MLNKTINNIKSDLDFMLFIQTNFMKPVELKKLPIGYVERRMPESELKKLPETEQKRITERSLIRDNIFKRYKFDIFKYPIVVFFEDKKGKKLKKFKLEKDAHNFSNSLINDGIYSMLINIMNYDIECKTYK